MATKTDPNLVRTSSNSTDDLVSVENPKSQKPSFLCLVQSLEKNYPSDFLRKVVAEIIATYLLVFVTCGAAAISTIDERRISKLGASLAGGLIVTVMIYAVGHVSGAHMNPAVTTAFAAVLHFPWKQFWASALFLLVGAIFLLWFSFRRRTGGLVPFYAAAQLTGAITAAFTLRVLLHPVEHVGTTSPSGSDLQALIMEIVVTFSMMFVTSAVATDTKAIGELAGIAVGSAVCITSILAGPVSGGSMNPARTLGPAIASSYYKGIWVYIIGPVVGTLLGACSYNLIRVTDKPVQAISPRSFSLKLRRMRSNDEQPPNKDPFDV